MPSHPIVRICPQVLTSLEVNWHPHHGFNCWGDGNGAEEVDSPKGSPAPGDVHDLDECKISCLLEPRCDAVLVPTQGIFRCFRKRNIQLRSCSPDMNFELYYISVVYPPSPPAPPLPPPRVVQSLVDDINERFGRKPYGNWSADGALADAGLLIHNFDGWEFENHEISKWRGYKVCL